MPERLDVDSGAPLVPGLILAGLYALLILVLVMAAPHLAPAYEVAPTSLLTKLRLVVTEILPMGFVVFLVVGLILLGWATPSEAAAFGAIGVLILASAFRCLTWHALVRSVSGALMFASRDAAAGPSVVASTARPMAA